jgi:2-haloacid dehalogenase
LDVLQKDAREVAFVDDRAINVEAANALGIHGIQYCGAESLKTELEGLGISLGTEANLKVS